MNKIEQSVNPTAPTFQDALKISVQHTATIMRRSPLLILIVGAIYLSSSIYFGKLQKESGLAYEEMLMGQLSLGLVSIFCSLILFFLAPLRILDEQYKRPNSSFWSWCNTAVWPLTLEGFRVFTRLLLWAILLILPAFYWYCRYLFVPYIVLLDPSYQNGSIDALEKSKELTQAIVWPLLAFQIATGLLSMGFETLESWIPFMNLELCRAIGTILSIILSLYTFSVIFELYQRAKTGGRE